MLDRVTITGADDNTPIQALIDLSAEFPFVEWAILVSKKQEGGPRFPSREWCARFSAQCSIHRPNLSLHVCGEWVRRIMRGKMEWDEMPEVSYVAGRVQINTHAEEHISTVSAFDWMAQQGRQFIIQLDNVNDHILDVAILRGVHCAGLFDLSHGAGILPESWPKVRHRAVYHGYAGGLSPENSAEQARIIAAANPWPFWIDMEGRVRTNEVLDLAKVRSVLESCAPLVRSIASPESQTPQTETKA